MQTTNLELPAGYGALVATLKVTKVPGLDGTLFVHEHAGTPGAQVASLRLKSNGHQVTFKHLWQPKEERMSKNGSRLLFRNAPNQVRGETWDSPSFQARRVAIYEGRNGPFAVTPYGILALTRTSPSAAKSFDVAKFEGAAQQMRDAVQAREAPASASTPKATANNDDLDAKVLAAVKARQGEKGVRWEDLLAAVQATGIGNDAAEAALQRLMDKGQAYEPTLGILRAT